MITILGISTRTPVGTVVRTVVCPRAKPQPAEAQNHAHHTVVGAIRMVVVDWRRKFRENGLSKAKRAGVRKFKNLQRLRFLWNVILGGPTGHVAGAQST